jgi:hypothetical protein
MRDFAKLSRQERDAILHRFASEMLQDKASIDNRLVLSELERIVYGGFTHPENARSCRLMFMSERDSLPLRSQSIVDAWIDKFTTEYQIERKCISNLITCHLDLGDSITSLADFAVTKIDDQQSGTQITHLLEQFRGQVIFLQFCRATATSTFLEILDQCYDSLMREQSHWEGKAIIITCFVDIDFNVAASVIQQHNIYSMYNVWLQDGWNGPLNERAVKEFGIHGVPHALLIDTEGYVQWRGAYIDDRNKLKIWIDALIEGRRIDIPISYDNDNDDDDDFDIGTTKKQKTNHVTDWAQCDDMDNGIDLLKSEQSRLFDDSTVVFVSHVQRNASKGKITRKGFLTFLGELSSDEKQLFEEQFFTNFVKKSIARDAMSRVLYFQRPFLPEYEDFCTLCEEDVSDVRRFIYPNGEHTLCEKCAEREEHRSKILLVLQTNEPSLKLRWGQQSIHQIPSDKLYDHDSNIPHHGLRCDACESPVVGYRYKCCHLSDFDLCSSCFKEWQQGEDGYIGKGICPKSWVFARIPPNNYSTLKMFYHEGDVEIEAKRRGGCGHSH